MHHPGQAFDIHSNVNLVREAIGKDQQTVRIVIRRCIYPTRRRPKAKRRWVHGTGCRLKLDGRTFFSSRPKSESENVDFECIVGGT